MPEVVIGADHPALPGHFPDHPVVPGVVVLSEVFAAVHSDHPGLVIEGVRQAKFLGQIKPDQPFWIDLGAAENGSLKFACKSADTVLVQGRLRVRAAADTG